MKTCETCIWWRTGANRTFPFPGKSECHINPPAALVGPDGRYLSIFPVTRGDDFCGLHESDHGQA
jgi:hypothetical protein